MTNRELLCGVAGLVLGGLLGLWFPQAAETPTPPRVDMVEVVADTVVLQVAAARDLPLSITADCVTLETPEVGNPSHTINQNARVKAGSTVDASNRSGR